METYPHLDNGIYDIINRGHGPHCPNNNTRGPRSDRGKDVSFRGAGGGGLSPLHPSSSKAQSNLINTMMMMMSKLLVQKPKFTIIPPKQLFIDLTNEDTITPSPKLQEPSPSAPNASSKTLSTKDTSSSSIDYTQKSPTLSSSPFTNGYLNPPLSPPPRVPPPPPTQAPNSMEITLLLSPITPLDVHHNSPSLSPLSLRIPSLRIYSKHMVIHAFVVSTTEPSLLG
ncbi:hypothetical protein Tco_0500852 [Tanacetum coccineum]